MVADFQRILGPKFGHESPLNWRQRVADFYFRSLSGKRDALSEKVSRAGQVYRVLKFGHGKFRSKCTLSVK